VKSLASTVAADAIAHRTVTAVELVQAALDRIDAVNPAVNAMVELRREQALAEAAAADAAIAAGEQVGRLHGVPVTVKEALAVAGMHRTWGDPNAADSISGEAAVAVDRLQHAGAIVLGTTNVAYGLADFAQTHNDLYGTTNNPWDTNRAAGGSSGGSAAALATGMSMLEIGSDLVGSVRIPASFCGVYGLRPSVGIVPTQGLLPPGAHPSPPEREIISTVGPMARSAADLRTALLAMAGPLPPEGRAWTWALPRPRCRRLHESRVSVVLDDGCAPVSAEVGDVLWTPSTRWPGPAPRSSRAGRRGSTQPRAWRRSASRWGCS
jgi:amidase